MFLLVTYPLVSSGCIFIPSSFIYCILVTCLIMWMPLWFSYLTLFPLPKVYWLSCLLIPSWPVLWSSAQVPFLLLCPGPMPLICVARSQTPAFTVLLGRWSVFSSHWLLNFGPSVDLSRCLLPAFALGCSFVLSLQGLVCGCPEHILLHCLHYDWSCHLPQE